MYEELYIISDEKRVKLDLNKPSGITLNFKSNLFSDLSKITCSYSYTFKLPLTQQNRIALDFPEDIRHQSSFIRKKLQAEFYINGVNLFRNANLYIDSISDSYQCVLTWDVLSGLQAMNDDDISIKELPNDNDVCIFGNISELATPELAFDNTAKVLYPIYDCGLPYYLFDISYNETGRGRYIPSRWSGFGAKPMPVVPVRKIIALINQYYNTTFDLGEECVVGDWTEEESDFDIITKGVIPLVGIDLNDDQLDGHVVTLSNPIANNIGENTNDTNNDDQITIVSVLNFGSIDIKSEYFDQYLSASSLKLNSHIYTNGSLLPAYDFVEFELDGCLTATFKDLPASAATPDELPTLKVYQRQREYRGSSTSGEHGSRNRFYTVYEELCSIEGEYTKVVNGYKAYVYDFSSVNGKSRLSCADLEAEKDIFFVFDDEVQSLTVDNEIKAILKNNDSCTDNRPIDIISNLPDISCLTFMKALFYMLGAFPIVDANGKITSQYYTELQRNIVNGNTLNWSKKDITKLSEIPSDIKFTASDYCQKNYYIMKSDDLDKTEREKSEETDVYADGVGFLKVNNSTLSISKTVIQLPFNAPYIKNKSYPSYKTGDTFKGWTLTDTDKRKWNMSNLYNKTEWVSSEPCYGIIYGRSASTTNKTTGEVKVTDAIMTMKVWNGFTELSKNSSYSYFQSIISDPFLITLNLNLDEFDLRDLDYTIPVYLEKYNSYFAIVSIQRDSSGNCKCELIKLP